jgi:hypothetical protein
MMKSIAFGLLAGCVVVVVLATTRSPRERPVPVTTSGIVRLPAATQQDVATRLFRIDDLIIRIANNDIAVTTQLPTTQPDAKIWPLSKGEIVDMIINLIQDTIDSDNWKDNGGAVGSIREMRGILIVTNTPAVLDQIEVLLEQLPHRAK